MRDSLAYLFRALNTQLLYRQGPVNVLLKVPYLLSIYLFKRWMRDERASRVTTITNFAGHLKIQVDCSKSMGASLYWTGFHEFKEMRFLNSYLRDDMNFVDVGANLGEFSLFTSRRLKNGKVYAFEPLSGFFDQLTHNVSLNAIRNIECFKLGLSDHSARLPIYFDVNNEEKHEGLATLFSATEQEPTEWISIDTLDEVAMREGIEKIDFIKIDVEGSEWAVLKGSEKILRTFRPALMIELNDATARRAGYDVNDMIAWLKAFGYEPYLISRRDVKPLKNRPAFCNAIFLASN